MKALQVFACKDPPYSQRIALWVCSSVMNVIQKKPMTTEYHCLEMPYMQLRSNRSRYLSRLTHSIERNGQLVPVILVPKTEQKWILIDGHLRVKALKRVGEDLIQSEVWDCSPTEALLSLLKERASSPLQPIEEALWLQEIYTQGGVSQNELAMRLGRDKSWVNRRLSLLGVLPEPVVQAVLKGRVSLWVASRILAPVARANAPHVERLLDYLLKETRSSRELQYFYEHYQHSNHPERTKMIQDPDLFFKAQKWLVSKKETQALNSGPEGQWEKQCGFILSALKKLIALYPSIFTASLPVSERHQLLKIFSQVKKRLTMFEKTLEAYQHD